MELDLDTFWGPFWCSHPGLSVACVSSSEGRDEEVEEGSFSVRILCSHSSLFPAVYEGRSARPPWMCGKAYRWRGFKSEMTVEDWAVGIQLRLWSSSELRHHQAQVGWGGVLDAAPQARGKFREVFLLNHGSHFPLQPACALPSARPVNSSMCPWPQSPCGQPSRLSRT